MNWRFFLYNLAIFSLLITPSCTEDDPMVASPEEESTPPVLNKEIIGETYPSANTTISIKDSIVINFLETPNLTQEIDGKSYRIIIDNVELVDVETESVWSEDYKKITLYPVNMLKANNSFTLKVNAHWEVMEGSIWKVLTFQGVEIRKVKELNFTTGTAELKINIANIDFTYPIFNQYHFLIEEYPHGFVKLKKGQESLFDLAGHEYKAVFRKKNGGIVTSPINYDVAQKLVSFPIPADLETETIYNLSLDVIKVSNNDHTTILNWNFRTSKFKTFAAKFNSITFIGKTFSILAAPWRGHYLHQFVASSEEYFDSFESTFKTIDVNPNGSVYSVPYATGLVRFEAILPGTDWYDKELYPLLYAPWTDPSFKPDITRDVSEVKNPPVQAMSVYDMGSGELTQEMIETGIAPAIAAGSQPVIRHHLAVIIWQDFKEIQAQVVQKYIHQDNIPERESKIIFSAMPPIKPGDYHYKVHYTLPSGMVTTTLDRVMIYY